MTDDTNKVGLDHFVSLEQDHEFRGWIKTFGCTEQQLRDAVRAVGQAVPAIRRYLDERRAGR
ncbi:MAG: DUF3606 domain-containing protein [Polaromonas sp.]|nr:DUF3606 domain-containing protein [Polaromonas sp.]